MCVSAAERDGEYLSTRLEVSRQEKDFHSFVPALSHYSAPSIIPLNSVVTADRHHHPDQLAASGSKATTTNTASSWLQRLAASARPKSHTQAAHNDRPQTRSATRGSVCKRRQEPSRVFHVFQNPEICLDVRERVRSDQHKDFLRGFIICTAACQCVPHTLWKMGHLDACCEFKATLSLRAYLSVIKRNLRFLKLDWHLCCHFVSI